MSYKYQSGAEKRRKRKLQEESAKKIKKITNFFGTQNERQGEQDQGCSSAIPESCCEKENIQPTDCETDGLGVTQQADFDDLENEQCYGADIMDAPKEDKLIPISKWPDSKTDTFINNVILNKPKSDSLEGTEKLYKDGTRSYYRSLNENNFYRVKPNGGKERRDWLIYDASSKAVYCYHCKLFSQERNNLTTTGLTDWKHLTEYLKCHEESKGHLKSTVALVTRSSLVGVIDVTLKTQVDRKIEYWTKLLQRIVATIKLLATQGLAFRGSDENINSRNKGNYLSCLVYLANFDEFLAEHLKRFASSGRGSASYLSHHICDEFIQIIKDELEKDFVQEIKEAKYFSIIVDSTPDISHQDQLTFILRYVNNGKIIERFFGFIAIKKHTAEHLGEIVINKLDQLGLDIKNCRGQSYDNASNMSGLYTGLQARIRTLSPTAIYIPCCNHSLNLVVNFASETSLVVSNYFSTIQTIYTFFSVSPQRWALLTDCGFSLKRLVDTRWSARFDAVNALGNNYEAVKNVFFRMSNDQSQKPDVRNKALGLYKKMNEFDMVILTLIWRKILERVNATSKTLQSVDLNVCSGVQLMKSLKSFIEKIRKSFDEIELEAKQSLGGNIGNIRYKDEGNRETTRKRFADETRDETILRGRDKFKTQVFYVICDSIVQDLQRRISSYDEISSLFKCFFTTDEEEIKTSIETLRKTYKNDIGDNLDNEFHHFKELCKNLGKKTISEVFESIQEVKATFPNISTILEIYMSIPLTNASGERSFSALKRIKNYLRSTMGVQRLDGLSMLYIESEAFDTMDCDRIIKKFAISKCRKMFCT